jgi:hypothetical protein
MSFVCDFCKKTFRREESLVVHLCESKRRFRERDEPGVRLGFQSYLKFYEITQGSAKLKTYEDFATSNYYRAFVKFGRHCVDLRAINPEQFVVWLLKNNKKIDHWCRDSVYDEWLHYWLPKESMQDALERGLQEIQSYVEQNAELRNGIADYFRYANANRIIYHISSGRISAWIVYNCDSGVEFLDQLPSHQVSLIVSWINPDIWSQRFKDYAADQEWAKHVLKQAGL